MTKHAEQDLAIPNPSADAADPEKRLRALRALENLRTNSEGGILDDAVGSDSALILGFSDGTQRKATITQVDTYEVTLDGSEVRHKLDFVYAFPPSGAKKIKKALRKDADVAKRGLTPAKKVRQRLKVSKMVLQRLVDEPLRARFTMISGAVVPCRVRRFGLYEVYADIKGAPITLFRHGVYQIHAGDELLVGPWVTEAQDSPAAP